MKLRGSQAIEKVESGECLVVRDHLLTLPSGSKPTSNEMNRSNSAKTVRRKTLGERRMGPGLARPDLPGLAARLAAKNISNIYRRWYQNDLWFREGNLQD
jgi:hypothetical protein